MLQSFRQHLTDIFRKFTGICCNPFPTQSLPRRPSLKSQEQPYTAYSFENTKHVDIESVNMNASDVLSQTLSAITSIKLDEISTQRSSFEDGKRELLRLVEAESDQAEKVRILLEGMEDLTSMGKLNNPLVSVKNVRRFIEQARHDPSASEALQKGWQSKLEETLDIHSLKYQYASLYGELVNEWLAANENSGESSSSESGFEDIGRKEMHEQRVTWEDYVFTEKQTNTAGIRSYLEKLFHADQDTKNAFKYLRESVEKFEQQMATETHFTEKTLLWVIDGILSTDLVTDEKRNVLKDFINNKIVLREIADVLNMRMSALDKWKWSAQGTPVEQRRQVNGRYRFYHDEDLLQALLLRYIGVRWSIFFKASLIQFRASAHWKTPIKTIPKVDQARRDHFLQSPNGLGVESSRTSHFETLFLEQLQDKINEPRGSYTESRKSSTDKKSPQDITQGLLHVLASDIILKTRLGEEICVVRSDFKWFGPSLPHSTMLTVLDIFGVSKKWVGFFRRALEAPMKFVQDGPNAPVRTRKRGTPISGPLSDMLGETTLFCLDFAMNQLTDGARLYRLHDDIWFWGTEKTCEKGWKVMTDFTQVMGLAINEEKTGCVRITRNTYGIAKPLSKKLPSGDVRWGFLKLDATTGRFLIDQDMVATHIEELRRQLAACRSIFDWIQAWNIYGARFFSNNFGRPANCFGLAHVDMMLQTFSHIQAKLFASTGGSVTSTLKQMITDRFGVSDIPEGYLYFPTSMGGLELKSPFISLYLIRDQIAKNTDEYIENFLEEEQREYRREKTIYEASRDGSSSAVRRYFDKRFVDESFMTMEEFTRYREMTSYHLKVAYEKMVAEPIESGITLTNEVAAALKSKVDSDIDYDSDEDDDENTSGRSWDDLSSYTKWIIQLYGPAMNARFGGLNIVERGLLPTGMVDLTRDRRFKWQQ